MMGSPPTSIVDSELHVHDLGRLGVIGVSVMPALTSTFLNAPRIMITEKGTAVIEGAARERLAA